jgi:hypothetical protein
MSELIEVREGKAISAATAETLEQVKALHAAASSAIDGLLSPEDADDADGDGDDQGEADDDGTQSPTDPNSALDAATPRSANGTAAVRVVPIARPVAIPSIERTFAPRGMEYR